jgi:DNA polymerase III subunit epsilon
MLPEKLAFVDLETTGARSAYDRIVEIGIVRVEGNVVTRTFHSLLNPLTHIPPEIERLTGIRSQDVIMAPVFSSITDEVMDILSDCTFVAHNVRFDYAFLKNELKRAGIDFTAKHFCTVKLSQYLFPQYRHHNLDSIIERFSLSCPNRHRALDDASVIQSFYQIVQKQFAPEVLIEAVNKALRKPSVPLHLKKEDLEVLPELPGVYIFYGDENTPLYIGKSKNIRDRVLSHFSADIRNGIEMKISQQIKQIETLPTAGELGALLLESKLIKEKLPLYNRRLRLKQQLTAVGIKQTPEGYDTLHTETVDRIIPGDLHVFSSDSQTDADSNPAPRIIGFFRSVKQAKLYLSDIAKDYGLCEKMLGLEKPTGACFGYRLDRCRGACVGKEKPLFYNVRLLEAISSIKIKPWPFNGPICIEEKNELAEKTDYFLIDKWCYLGSITDDSVDSFTPEDTSLHFDLDVYKILRQYITAPKNGKNIKDVPAMLRQKFTAPDLGSLV